MAWEEVPGFGKKGSAGPAQVTVAVNAPDGRYSRRMTVTVWPSKIEGGLPFWCKGATVKVLLGTGEHAGRLMVKPDGAHQLTKLGHGATNGISLVMPLPPGITCAKVSRTPVEFDYQDKWLEITLPAAMRQVPAPQAPATQTPAPSKPTPFRTAASTPGTPRPITGGR